MPDNEYPELVSAISDEPQADAMTPPTGEKAVSKATHEVDVGDMGLTPTE